MAKSKTITKPANSKATTSKATPKAKHAPLALRNAAEALFAEYGWPGNLVGRPSVRSLAAAGPCPDGKTPHDITFKRPDGTVVTQTVCL